MTTFCKQKSLRKEEKTTYVLLFSEDIKVNQAAVTDL